MTMAGAGQGLFFWIQNGTVEVSTGTSCCQADWEVASARYTLTHILLWSSGLWSDGMC